MANFDPLQNRFPLIDRQNIVTADYIGDHFICVPNLMQIRPPGASVQIGEIIYRENSYLFIDYPFHELTCRLSHLMAETTRTHAGVCDFDNVPI